MTIVDHEKHMWILFQDSKRYLFDANCNHSAIGYSVLIELNEQECESYNNGGRDYLTNLSRIIQDSAPILKESDSPFKNRDLTSQLGVDTTKAFQRWNSQ